MKRHRRIQTSQIAKRRRRLFFIRVGLLFLLLLGVLIGIWFLLRASFINIQNIDIIGNENLSANVIRQIANDDLAGSYYFLFPKSNILFYPKEKIRTDIENRFSEISDVSIGRKNVHDLVISIVIRKPFSLWCKNTNEVSVSTTSTSTLVYQAPADCYFLDKSGFVFQKAATSSDTYLSFLGPLLIERGTTTDATTTATSSIVMNPSEPIGKYYLQLDQFQNIIKLTSDLKNAGFQTASVTWDGETELDLQIQNGYVIKTAVSENPNLIIENLESLLSSDAYEEQAGSKSTDNLKYVDLRFGNKVYFKFKGE